MTLCTPRIPPPSRHQLTFDVFFVCFYMTVAFALLSTWLYDISYAFSPAKALLVSASDTTPVPPQDRSAGTEASPRSEEDVRKQAEEASRAQDAFLREERVLIRRGELQLEFSTFYSMDTQDRLIPVPGGNSLLVKSKNREVSVNLLGRYGLINNLELIAEIPLLVYTEQTTELQIGGLEQTLDATGVGDLSGSLRYQLWRESTSIPDIIVELNGQFATGDDLRWFGDEVSLGTGAWEMGGGITFVKTLDPVVFFGRLEYTHRFGDLGDVFALSLGTGFSLNDRVSFNMQVLGAFVDRSEVDRSEVDEATLSDNSTLEIISMQFAVTILMSKRLFVEPVVNFGLSNDATDVVVGVNMPFQL